ncbi:hypothetical protein F0L68_41425, partial [Solihabitans fulvus]
YFTLLSGCGIQENFNLFLRIKVNKNINKMSAWRQAGLTYINYSNIAAKVLRRSLKQEFRAEALKRDESHVRVTPWANGRPAHEKD